MKREQGIVFFESFAECDRTSVLDVIVLETEFFKTVHHFHALTEFFAALTSDVVVITVKLAQAVVVF